MSSIKQNISFSISPSTIFWLVVIYLASKLLTGIYPILILTFIALLISIAVSPVVSYLESKKIPRNLSASLLLFIIFAGVVSIPISIIIPMIDQTTFFLQKLPELFISIIPQNLGLSLDSFLPQFSGFSSEVFKFAANTFSGILTIFTLIIIAYYLLQERPHWPSYFHYLFGAKGSKYLHIAIEIESKLGRWVRGELLLMLLVGCLNYIGFLIVGIPFAIPLALIAGILEVIPNIGPTIAGFPAAIVGFSISPSHGFATMLVSILVQQIENGLLVPKIMKSAIGTSPVINILAIMIGFKLGGPLLALLSLPIVLVSQIIITHVSFNRTHNLPEIS